MEMSTCVEVTYPPSPQVQCLFPAERLLREISACDMVSIAEHQLSAVPPIQLESHSERERGDEAARQSQGVQVDADAASSPGCSIKRIKSPLLTPEPVVA
ncbi:hypothetical protein Q7C36_006713 [Tachysurus vachellii]|uniref:Uncharacterized protein n=1 Tax=Tachysurus vachellii TaxID=175792 RepID=A0AA88NK19_TACVA|nr:hypothetical protein Q7C36_006713 [Tachysurus vachellii]